MAIFEHTGSTIPKNGSTGSSLEHQVEQVGAAAQEGITKVAEATRPAVERLTASAHQAVEKLMQAASVTADTVAHKSEQLMDAQERLVEDCRTYVRQKPVTSVAIAVGLGYLLSRLLASRD